VMYDEEEEDLVENGLTFRLPNVPFALSTNNGKPVTVVQNMSNYIFLVAPSNTVVTKYNSKSVATIKYEYTSDGHTSIDVFEAGYANTGGYLFGWNSGSGGYITCIPNAGETYSGRPMPERGA